MSAWWLVMVMMDIMMMVVVMVEMNVNTCVRRMNVHVPHFGWYVVCHGLGRFHVNVKVSLLVLVFPPVLVFVLVVCASPGRPDKLDSLQKKKNTRCVRNTP